VALIHLGFLIALLLTDRLTFHKGPEARPMTVYRLPDDKPKPATVPLSLGSLSRLPIPSAVMTPRLNGPMILIQPETSVPPSLRGFDLSPPKLSATKPLTQDDLMPSKEKRLKQFFADQEEANRLAKEPSAGEDCVASTSNARNAASLGESAFKDPLPIESICSPRGSAKELSKRNDRFAPQ
jgi:hypothetical protein